jgi:hypothetical protein
MPLVDLHFLGAPRYAVGLAMSTTVTDTDASVGFKIIQKAAGATTAVKAKHRLIWPMLGLMMGLFASLTWSGFLGWVIGRIIGVW